MNNFASSRRFEASQRTMNTIEEKFRPCVTRHVAGEQQQVPIEPSMDCIEDFVPTIIILPNLWCRPNTTNHQLMLFLELG